MWNKHIQKCKRSEWISRLSGVRGPKSADVVHGVARDSVALLAAGLWLRARSREATGALLSRDRWSWVRLSSARADNPGGRVVGRDRAGLESPFHLLAAEFPPSASFKNQTPEVELAPCKPVILCTDKVPFQWSRAMIKKLFCLGSGKEKETRLDFGVQVSPPTSEENSRKREECRRGEKEANNLPSVEKNFGSLGPHRSSLKMITFRNHC